MVNQTKFLLIPIAIIASIPDIASSLLVKNPKLSLARDEDGCYVLVKLAMSTVFKVEKPLSRQENLLYSWWRMVGTMFFKALHVLRPRGCDAFHKEKQLQHEAIELCKLICKSSEGLKEEYTADMYRKAVIRAAYFGNHQIIEEIHRAFPSLIYHCDIDGINIMHAAVQNRHEELVNLIYRISASPYSFFDAIDSKGNNYMHLAAKLAPPHKLNLVAGPALQMQRELQWFKGIAKFVHPSHRARRNNESKSPQMIFTEQHQELKREGEKWMKDTATSCSIVAGLITTLVFTFHCNLHHTGRT